MLHRLGFENFSPGHTGDAFRKALAKGDRARAEGDWPVASASYAEALRIDDTDGALWVQYGHALKEGGALDPAIAAYRAAGERRPDCADARLHLAHALKRAGALGEAEHAFADTLRLRECPAVRTELRALGLDGASLAAIRETPGVSLALDVTDLIRHVRFSRILTGIQRVQVDMVEGLAALPADPPTLVAFDAGSEEWVAIPLELVRRIGQLAARGGRVDNPDWRGLVAALDAAQQAPEPVSFARGATLVNLGTSWWLRNYFLAVRRLKERFAVRYVPFVHDLIPLVAGEHCTPTLRRDFLRWLGGIFDHADGFVVNSKATRDDLLAVAKALGHTIPVGEPVRLDGRPRTAPRAFTGQGPANPFVLFVSTLESRKNHFMAFDAWHTLIRERGEAAVPDLVCVGSAGWMVEAALARLAASPALSRKVRILSNVGDTELAQLYADCLFTLYPSAYEGWGLPITEALSRGKIPLVADATSLPEAGGDFAVYFDPRSARDFDEKLRRLLDDASFRQVAEDRIREGFAPRSWSAVAGDLLAALPAPGETSSQPFALEYGAFHHLGASAEPTWPPEPRDGERFRTGTGWDVPEPDGCVARPGTGFAFRLVGEDNADAAVFLCLAIEGPGGAILKRAHARTGRDGAVVVDIGALLGPEGARLLGFTCMRCDDAPAMASFIEAAIFHELAPLGAVPSC